MRVITGTARGRKLKEPVGMDTRPTTDRVKEGIFSSIQFEIEGRRVLDLFGGTGQMGIEALSRGAAGATFVDSSRDAVRIITANVKKCRMEDRAEILASDYRAFLLSSPARKYGVVFLDPPYGTAQLKRALKTLESVDIVAKCGIIVCESEKDEVLPDDLKGYTKTKEYFYGRPKVTLYIRNAD